MPTSRSIPPEAWAHAREAVRRYFVSRQCSMNAEDLAQTTLLKVWEREDYEFTLMEDFLRVCLGFARMVALEHQRLRLREHAPLDFDAPAPAHSADSHRAMDARMQLEDVCRTGEANLKREDWQMICDAAAAGDAVVAPAESAAEANRRRVSLHRARRKLGFLTGWRKE